MARCLSTLALALGVSAQHIGTAREETHLAMPIQHCTLAGGCAFEATNSVLDSNWRWTHKVGCTNSTTCNCFLGNSWVNATCNSIETCTDECALDGEDVKGYREKYGVQVDGSGLINLTFVTHYETEGANGTNVGSRMYLLEDENHYKMFNLLNKEFTFTIDSSKLPCGLNGAVYFVEMEADGGAASYSTNYAGAKYGTGYCDAQCPHDIKWIAGEANVEGWIPTPGSPTTGLGHYGTCCAELDIWEANKISTQMTVHSCTHEGYYRCEGVECGDNNGKNSSDPGDRFKGNCDKNGCDLNPYRVGAHDFYGPGPSFQIDSTKPVRVVTQFITDDGTENGTLIEMRRFYIQDNKTVYNPTPSYATAAANFTSITEDMCTAQMTNFSDHLDFFQAKGGVAGMGEAMKRGMSLVFSLWDDHEVGMIWLDATDPYPATKAGALRGTCNQTSGNATLVEKNHPDAYVLYSDVRYGEIGSTYGPGAPPPPPLCPGGSEDSCIATCDPTNPTKYLQCIHSCDEYCPHASKAKATKKRVATPSPQCPTGSEVTCIRACDPKDPNSYLRCIKTCDAVCPHESDGSVGAAKRRAEAQQLSRRLAEASVAEVPALDAAASAVQIAKAAVDHRKEHASKAAGERDEAHTRWAATSSLTATSPHTSCTPNGGFGCLNGVQYSFADQFPCGSHDVYNYSDHLCCEQGRPFRSTDQYCCTGAGRTGIHGYADGKCNFTTLDRCTCDDEVVTPPPLTASPVSDNLVDTSSPPEGGYLCDGTQATGGCLNGYLFGWDSHTACGGWLIGYGHYGCCPSALGFLPYPLGITYCCKVEGAPAGHDYNISTTACKCNRYGCP